MGRQSRVWIFVAVAVAALGALLYWLHDAFPGTLEDGQTRARLVYSVLLLTILIPALLVRRRAPLGSALRYAAIWIALGAVLLLGYSLKDEAAGLFHRLRAELLPHTGMTSAGEIAFRAQRGGHFVVEADVDGTPVRFMVDTGASDVVLSLADAKRLGFDPEALRFDKVYRTANGTVMGAPVRLRRVRVGPIELADVRASVNSAPMQGSLLGMSFLGRLSSYRVEGDRLMLER